MAEEKEFEMVSAAMDGELTEAELNQLLLEGSDGIRDKWYEYHLIRDCLQHSTHAIGRDIEFISQESFLAKLDEITQKRQAMLNLDIEQKVEKAVLVHDAANSHSFRWFSVAASILAVAVIAWQMLPVGNHASLGGEVAEMKKQSPSADNAVLPVAAKPDAAVSKDREEDVVMPNVAVDQNDAEIKSAVQIEKPAEDKSKQAREIKQIAQ